MSEEIQNDTAVNVPEDDVVIRVRGLKKSYTIIDTSISLGHLFHKNRTRYPIFDGIDLDVHRGDIVGILGRNGCGKSTFLKLVSEILKPDEGPSDMPQRDRAPRVPIQLQPRNGW